MKQFLLAGAMILTAFSATPAPLPDECERITGTVTCVDPVGNSEESGGQSQEVTSTSQGNRTNKLECSGPGNSSAGC